MASEQLINSNLQTARRHSLYSGRYSIIKPVVEQKLCLLCDEQIDIDGFAKHTAECIGPENILIEEPLIPNEPDDDHTECTLSPTEIENIFLPSIQQPLVYDQPDDDHPEHAANDIEPENTLPNTLLPLIQQPLLYEAPVDDHATQAASSIEGENAVLDLLQSPIQLSLDHEKPVDDHAEHTVSCTESENTLPDTSRSSIQPSADYCELNDDSASHFRPVTHVDDDDDDDDASDVFLTPDRMSPETIDKNPKKYCVLCDDMIDESQFIDHMTCCSEPSPIILRTDKKSQIFSYKSKFSTDDDDEDSLEGSYLVNEQLKECIICFKPIKESEYVAHVNACLSEETSFQTRKKATASCFSCHRSVNIEENLSREMSCPSHHIYCIPCLQHSMEDFARNRLVPLCHPTSCDYQLSQHDISLIPLERRISDRLFKLAKGQHRPQCPKCHFYIDINDNEDFYDHVDACGDLIPCEYCSCPYSVDQLGNHTTQCRSDKSSENNKLIHFIMKRTKYPFTPEQINLFIQQKKKRNSPDLDPLSIVEALAVFGSIFPYDLPTKDCDVCLEACRYEDIYVFDCTDSHKLCYSCYHRSCITKMSNNEILTCGLCSTPLRDGELKQLRISEEEIRKIRDYQIKKALDDYSNHTHGIIKCPNQKCSWIAEAADPTERFKVQCPACKREFCSLCNQQYHYRTTCQQLPQITQQWYIWCQTDRTRYLTMQAKENAAYAARLNEYNQQMKENENRNEELRRRYEELMHDEQYKVQNCRLCPSCKRVVQRLEGCDKMICGQDAHGGNIQSGCGTKFNWLQAQPYTATSTFQAQQSSIDLPKPENPIVEHIGVKCDACQNDVKGIRFDCVHCPSLTYCEKCEQQSTLDHSQENQRMNQQSHVFRLLMTPEEITS